MIYLDNAATTLTKPPQVIQAVIHAMGHMGNSARGGHQEALAASRTIYLAREALAELFGCPLPENVVFTSNSTEALNTAIYGLIEPGSHVITTDLEHNSVLRPLYRMEAERQVSLSFVPADKKGRIRYEDFEALLRPSTRAIVCTHASNLTGQLLDIQRIGDFARKHGLLFILDASQTAGVFPISMTGMGIDVVCFTGHKSLLGPQGTGGMCIRPGLRISPLKVGGSGIRTYDRVHPDSLPVGLEAGTLNGHGIAGLLAGVEFIKDTGLDRIRLHEQDLERRFYQGVSSIPGVTVYGDFSTDHRAPVVALNIWDHDSSQISDELSCTYGIATRPGAHCAPRMHQALGTVEQGAVRFSFSWFNTKEEVLAAVQAVKEMAGEAD
ncbi:MAG: aminotransferase class V-fold PLP-dependent enzyme [Eubacteriales bacterium]|nr:aminotransferase class V-fold PLP-dependent enzyme [Eubacteriales bacterium]